MGDGFLERVGRRLGDRYGRAAAAQLQHQPGLRAFLFDATVRGHGASELEHYAQGPCRGLAGPHIGDNSSRRRNLEAWHQSACLQVQHQPLGVLQGEVLVLGRAGERELDTGAGVVLDQPNTLQIRSAGARAGRSQEGKQPPTGVDPAHLGIEAPDFPNCKGFFPCKSVTCLTFLGLT